MITSHTDGVFGDSSIAVKSEHAYFALYLFIYLFIS